MAGCADTMVQNSPNSECVICCEEIFGKSEENCPREPRETLKHLKKDDYELVLENAPSLPPRPYRLGYNCATRKFKCKKRKETKEKCFETLEMPIGIAFSTLSLSEYNLTSEKLQRSQAYSTCLVAFAETYLTPESEWDSIILNRVMTEGNRHYLSSLSAIQALMPDEDIVDINENLVSTTVVLCRNNFDLELFQPFVIGQLSSRDPTVPTFAYSCKLFFRKYNYCLLSVAGLHFFIWRRYGSFFLFDPNGRDTNFKRDFEAGCIIVLALRSFDNLNCYITKLSGLKGDEVFTMRRIRVIWLLPFIPPNTIYKRVRSADYSIIDDEHANLKGHIHLEMTLFAEFHGKLYHVIAMIAILLSKIDPPSTWDSYVVDEILMLSKSKYAKWTKRNGADLRIEDIPTIVNLGTYKIKSQFLFCELCGTWAYVPNYRFSHLSAALRQMFSDSTNLILEIGSRFYPIWKRQGFFYLLDTYQHGCTSGSSVVHMCSTINSLCCVLHYNVLEIMAPTDFAIHKVVIIEILKNDYYNDLCLDEYSMIYEPKNEEIVSLNESIEDIQWTLDMNEEQHFAADDYQNLDSPGISATQIVPDYMALKDTLDGPAEFNLDELREDGHEMGLDVEVGDVPGLNAVGPPKEQRTKDGKDREAKDRDGKDQGGKDQDGKSKGGKDQDGKGQGGKDKAGKDAADQNKDKGGKGQDAKDKEGKGGDASKGADSKGGDTSKGADSKGGDTSKGADSKGGDNTKGTDGRGGDTTKGTDGRGGDTTKGTDGRGGDTTKGTDGRAGDTTKGTDGRGGDTTKGTDGRGGDTRGGDTTMGTDGRGGDRGTDGRDGDRGTDGRDGGRSVDGRDGGRTSDGRDGGRNVDGRDGGRNVDGRDGGRSVDGRDGGRSTDGRDGGRSTDGRDGGRSTDGRDGGRSTDGRGGDRTTDGRDGGRITDGRDGGRTTDGRDGGRTTDGRDGGRTTDGRGGDRTGRTADDRGRDIGGRGGIGRDGDTRSRDGRGTHPRGRDGRRDRDDYDDGDDVYENLTNAYPGYTCTPHNLAVAGSQTGSPESISNLITTALKVADRVLVMVPGGNFIVFKFGPNYLLYDGCTCNIDRFRHLDLTKGTAGLLCFATMAELVDQIMCGNALDEDGTDCSQIINDIVDQYGN